MKKEVRTSPLLEKEEEKTRHRALRPGVRNPSFRRDRTVSDESLGGRSYPTPDTTPGPPQGEGDRRDEPRLKSDVFGEG